VFGETQVGIMVS